VKYTLLGLWRLEEVHHDQELPYEPGRLAPGTRLPRDTREEVLLKHKEAFEKAQSAGGESRGQGDGSAAGRRTGSEAETASVPAARRTTGPVNHQKPDHNTGGVIAKLPMRLVGLVALLLAFVLSRLEKGQRTA
jgi:hypothetical protein